MITYITLAIICLVIAIVLGKVVFPKLAQLYSDNNQDMVNMATLQTNAEIQKRQCTGIHHHASEYAHGYCGIGSED